METTKNESGGPQNQLRANATNLTSQQVHRLQRKQRDRSRTKFGSQQQQITPEQRGPSPMDGGSEPSLLSVEMANIEYNNGRMLNTKSNLMDPKLQKGTLETDQDGAPPQYFGHTDFNNNALLKTPLPESKSIGTATPHSEKRVGYPTG